METRRATAATHTDITLVPTSPVPIVGVLLVRKRPCEVGYRGIDGFRKCGLSTTERSFLAPAWCGPSTRCDDFAPRVHCVGCGAAGLRLWTSGTIAVVALTRSAAPRVSFRAVGRGSVDEGEGRQPRGYRPEANEKFSFLAPRRCRRNARRHDLARSVCVGMCGAVGFPMQIACYSCFFRTYRRGRR